MNKHRDVMYISLRNCSLFTSPNIVFISLCLPQYLP